MQSVVHFILTLSGGNFAPTDPSFIKIDLSLPSVTKLETRPPTLHHILDPIFLGNHPHFFGLLETVKLTVIDANFEASFLFAFLMHRKLQGLPISTIEFHIQPTSLRVFGDLSMFRRLIWVEGGSVDQKPENTVTKAQRVFTQKLWDFVGASNACISINSLTHISHFPSQIYASTLPSDYFHF